MCSRAIEVVANAVLHPFPWLSNIPVCEYIMFCLSITCCWACRLFPLFAVVNPTAVNMRAQDFVGVCFHFSWRGVAGSGGNCLIFEELPDCFQSGATIFHPREGM